MGEMESHVGRPRRTLAEFPQKERDRLIRQPKDRCGCPTHRSERRNTNPEA
jgi:hypothetical protein